MKPLHPAGASLRCGCLSPVYRDSSGHWQAFVVEETGGSWGTAQEVPGSAALNAGGYANVNSVSCASAGNCAAGGITRILPATPRRSW
jgi:hypothetical protein